MIRIGLPAYNEAGRIEKLLSDISKSFERGVDQYLVTVYDDGSNDETASKVLSMRDKGIKLELIPGGQNKGLGHALCYLVDYFVKASSLDDTVIIMDADATHNPAHIHRMLNFIQDGFDVVIASRYTPYSRIRGLSIKRRILSDAANLIFRVLFPAKGVADYSCSYRAYTAKILKLAKEAYGDCLIEERSFACMAELLIKLRSLDIIICEVPLILRYDRKSGPTKMRVASNIISSFKLVIKSLFLSAPDRARLDKLKEKYQI